MEGNNEEFTQLGLNQLMQIYDKNEGKHCLVFDKNGNCATFFAYQAALIEFHKEVVAAQGGIKSKEDALEVLRNKTALVMGGLATSNNLVIDIAATRPDFANEFTAGPELYPTALVFDKEQWANRDNHIKIVREAENRSAHGAQGQFAYVDKFNITILAKYVSDDECNEYLKKLPNPEAWAKFIIN